MLGSVDRSHAKETLEYDRVPTDRSLEEVPTEVREAADETMLPFRSSNAAPTWRDRHALRICAPWAAFIAVSAELGRTSSACVMIFTRR
jgi:hypothetical protein